MEKILYHSNSVRAIITGPSNSSKTHFLTNLILIIIDVFSKIYLFSLSLHQEFHQKIIKCFNVYFTNKCNSKYFKRRNLFRGSIISS